MAVGTSFLPPFFRAGPYCLAAGMSLSDALRGSLEGQGYVYQFVFRFSALAFLPASAGSRRPSAFVIAL